MATEISTNASVPCRLSCQAVHKLLATVTPAGTQRHENAASFGRKIDPVLVRPTVFPRSEKASQANWE